MTQPEDKRVIACNLAEPISEAAKGALAYVYNPNRGNGGERVYLVIKSRGGRWIKKWESMRRLENFRFKTLPPEHPLYSKYDWWPLTDSHLAELQEAYNREHS